MTNIKIGNYEEIKSNLFISVMNETKHREIQNDIGYQIPSRNIGDLRIVCQIQMKESHEELEYVLVTDGILKALNISEDKLFEDAIKNSESMMPQTIQPLTALAFGSKDPNDFALVITTRRAYKGASALFYPKTLETLSQELGDCYILPSSIHEVIALPKDCIDLEQLKLTVRDINRTVVSKDDWLSDNVYYYDTANKELKIA